MTSSSPWLCYRVFRAGPHFWAQTAWSSISKVPQFPAPKTGSPRNPTCIDFICMFFVVQFGAEKAFPQKYVLRNAKITMKLQDFLRLYLSKFQKFTLLQTTSNHFRLYQNLQLDPFPDVLLWLGRFENGHLIDHDSLKGPTRVIFSKLCSLCGWLLVPTNYWMDKTCNSTNLNLCICSSVWAAKGRQVPVSHVVHLTWTLENDVDACMQCVVSRCLCTQRSPKSVQLLHFSGFQFATEIVKHTSFWELDIDGAG